MRDSLKLTNSKEFLDDFMLDVNELFEGINLSFLKLNEFLNAAIPLLDDLLNISESIILSFIAINKLLSQLGDDGAIYFTEGGKVRVKEIRLATNLCRPLREQIPFLLKNISDNKIKNDFLLETLHTFRESFGTKKDCESTIIFLKTSPINSTKLALKTRGICSEISVRFSLTIERMSEASRALEDSGELLLIRQLDLNSVGNLLLY